jgi:hypothetical protein
MAKYKFSSLFAVAHVRSLAVENGSHTTVENCLALCNKRDFLYSFFTLTLKFEQQHLLLHGCVPVTILYFEHETRVQRCVALTVIIC